MSTIACRSNNKKYCRFHGATKSATTTQFREALTQSHHTYVKAYKANPSGPETYNLYAALRVDQKNYYSTDEGLDHLETCVTNKVGDQIQIANLKREAISYRMETEMKEGGSEWSKPTKTLDAFPLLAEKKPIAGIHALSTETYSDGSSTNYMWDEENHSVYVEGIQANGEADVDDMRDIGKAATRDQAIYTAYNWWRLRK